MTHALFLTGLLLTSAPQADGGDGVAQAVVEGIDVDALLRGMTLEQKVGQLMFVDLSGRAMNSAIRHQVSDKRVGGVALFGHNIRDRAQVRALTRAITALDTGGVPPFISVDQEGGHVLRINGPEAALPSAMALGATRSATMAETAGRVIGADLRGLGISMNLAPVLDVNSNPKNPVIGTRSFGERPELVAELGLAFIRGLQQAGVIAVAKHFPGHGATGADSHYGLPSLDVDLARLRAVELVPFQRAIGGGLEALMTAHIALPRVAEAPALPATLSRRLIGEILRRELGFDGIVLTDGLEMLGIVERYGLGSAAVKAVQAGADMVLVVWTVAHKEDVRRALLDAVASGELTEERVDRSVRRILRAKARHHLLPRQTPILPAVTAAEREINAQIARRAQTLVRNRAALLPLHPRKVSRVLALGPGPHLAQALRAGLAGVEVDELVLSVAPTRQQRARDTRAALARAERVDAVVVGLVNGYYVNLVWQLRRRLPQLPVAVVSFGSPYMLEDLPEVDAYLCAYSDHETAQQAAAETLTGHNPPTGVLPVTLGDAYPFGHGLRYPEPQPDAGRDAAGDRR